MVGNKEVNGKPVLKACIVCDVDCDSRHLPSKGSTGQWWGIGCVVGDDGYRSVECWL